MVDIFEEVDEELRRDKYQDLARQYGPLVLGVAAAIILGTAGYQGWHAWQTSTRERASDTYEVAIAALEAGRAAQAVTGFDTLVESGTDSYATLALMQRAAMALEAGDNTTAAAFYEQAASRTAEPTIRDLARLKAVWALWDALSFSDVEIRLTPLTTATSPYRHLAREAIAVAALRAGDMARAQREYQFLSTSFDAPQGVARRALEGLALIAASSEPDEADMAAPMPADAASDAATEIDTEQASAGDSGDD